MWGVQIISMARPTVVPGLATETRLDGIEVDVTNELQKIFFMIDQLGLETPPEERAIGLMRSVKSLGIDSR